MKLRGIDDTETDREISINDILVSMQDGEHNIEMKTRVNRPLEIALVMAMASHLGRLGFDSVKLDIKKVMKKFLKLVVSLDGLGRKEILEAVKGIIEREERKKTISEKIMG